MEQAIFRYKDGTEEERSLEYYDDYDINGNHWKDSNLYVYAGRSWIYGTRENGKLILVEKYA